MKLSKMSDGYKKGLRYIDFGESEKDSIKYLKKVPEELKKKR